MTEFATDIHYQGQDFHAEYANGYWSVFSWEGEYLGTPDTDMTAFLVEAMKDAEEEERRSRFE